MDKFFLRILLAGLIVLLSACGEDSFTADGTGGTGTTGTTGEQVVYIGSGVNTSFTPGLLNIAAPSLAAGGATSVSATLQDSNGLLYTQSTTVTFSSTCTALGTATLDTVVTTASGIATSNYVAQGCDITDTITAAATLNGANKTATGSVTVAPASVGSIQFISAVPSSVALLGTGGKETSIVKFKVVDTTDGPVIGQSVTFSLSTTVGGLTLTPATAISGSGGFVQTIIQAGTISTSVRVTATIDALGISTQSNKLVVSTGIPDQNSFSISLTALNPAAWAYNGVKETVSVYLADHFNNPVPDGTTIAFQTEGGQIEPACTTIAGTCAVVWTSSDPRPGDELVGDHIGRVTIIATALGEESFADTAPSDGRFQDGETYTDLPEPFRDDDEDGTRDAGEEYLDTDSDQNYDIANSLYNGALCTTGAACTKTLLHVRAQIVLIMSSETVTISAYRNCDTSTAPIDNSNPLILSDDGALVGVCIKVLDSNLQPPPTGTLISGSVDIGSISGVASSTPGDFVGNPYATNPLSRSKGLNLTLKGGPCTPPDCIGTLTAEVSGTGGSPVSASFPIAIQDVTPPIIESVTPVAGTITVVPNDPIKVVFDEPMASTSITSNSIKVVEDPDNAGGTVINSVFVTYDAASNTATFLPANMNNAPGGGDMVYEVTVIGATPTPVVPDTAVTDVAGTSLAASFSWRFKTAALP